MFENSSLPKGRSIGVVTVILRTVIGLNFARFALSFLPWFEGSANGPGVADRLFNPHHTYGFRSDFIWLFFSTIAISFAMIASVSSFKESHRSRVNFYLSLAWVAAYVIYVLRCLFTGVLDFG